MSHSLESFRKDFPVLAEGKLVYADSGASSLTPTQVIESMDTYYRSYRANVHRGMHSLSLRATEEYECARKKIAHFINAAPDEVIITRGTTDSLNMAARMLRSSVGAGDEIIVSVMEHHSNLVPWQELARDAGAVLRFVPLTEGYELDMDAFERLLSSKTKVVAITHMSNVLGSVVDIKTVCALAHKVNAFVVVDAAQSVPHMRVDVRDLGCDFLAFSGHKMCGPTGVGVLFGKRLLLDLLPPVLFGGDMIREVSSVSASWNVPPYKFEAGTPPIAEVIGLGAAVGYLQNVGMEHIERCESELRKDILGRFDSLPQIRLFGPSQHGGLVFSFTVEGFAPDDVAQLCDAENVCVRSGHLCAMPLIREVLGTEGIVRASFSWYTSVADVERFFTVLGSIVGGRK